MIDIPPSSAESDVSGSDDGGFLPKRGGRGRASWRRPLVSCPSQLSFQSDEESEPSQLYKNIAGLFRIGNRNKRLLKSAVPIEYHSPPIDQSLHINTISGNIPGPIVQTPYTPSKVSRIISSSPAASSPLDGVQSPWSPHIMYFSDLSSVQQPSSAERSFPSQISGSISQLRYIQERYSQELPSLRAIHEETRRMAQNMVPLQVQMHSPTWRYSQPVPQQQQQQQQHHHHHHHHYPPYRQRSRLLPRFARMARSAPELGSPHFNMAMHLLERSPESRSSSSGFGSKNTSTQQNQSSQSGTSSAHEWRYLPPYKPPPPPPPPPPTTISDLKYYSYQPPSSRPRSGIDQYQPNTYLDSHPSYSMDNWLELITQLNASSDPMKISSKSVDVGSVDGHYEFDPATPTPTASTPTGPRDDPMIVDHSYPSSSTSTQAHLHQHYGIPTTAASMQYYQRKRLSSKYDNIEARVQAMKEEFYAYKKRQGTRHIELESAC